MEKYEHVVMGCAIQQTGEFSISELHEALHSTGKTKLGKASVQVLLDRLVKKKLIKKRYSRIKYLKFQPVYRSCFSRDFYLAHVEAVDLSNERHKKALEAEYARKIKVESNPIYSFLYFDLAPGIMEQGYLPEKEWSELKKRIDELE